MAKQGIHQDLRQQQRLNQRQMFLGRLLEMSEAEFEEEIVRALEENPALAVLDAPADTPDDNGDDTYDEYEVTGRARKERGFYQVASAATGVDSLADQLAELHLSDLERETARYVIGNLDSSGFLTRTAAEIADDMAMTIGIEVDIDTVERVIYMVRALDPAGIGASDLQECLLLQLDRLNDSAPVMLARRIVSGHYNEFFNNRLLTIQASLGADDSSFADAVRLIKSLNPKPGAGLHDQIGNDPMRHITPDFVVEIDDNGRIVVSLTGQIPQLVVDEVFRDEGEQIHDSEAEKFIRERRDNAEDYIDAVGRRNATLMKIMNAIMRLQPRFFNTFNLNDLQPMVIRDVEEITGLDKSVISRATSTKYMATPDGSIILLKSLFSERAGTETEVSRHSVEAAITDIIEHEDKAHPLSDDAITDALKALGMPVARRTVAKYRERLGFPVARIRLKAIKTE